MLTNNKFGLNLERNNITQFKRIETQFNKKTYIKTELNTRQR